MKKILLLLILFSVFGFDTANDPGMSLKVTKVVPLEAGKYDVTLELHNGYDRKINFLSMYCSDSGFYSTDNPNVVVTPKPCDKNFPTAVPIARNSYRIATLELELKNAKQAKFRIGFKFVEIPKGVDLTYFDSTSVKSIMVWSNVIEFKSR